MKRVFRRSIAAFLAILLLVSVVPLNAFAEEQTTAPVNAAEIDRNSPVAVTGNNAVGGLIADGISEEVENQQEQFENFPGCISDITVEASTAIVEFYTTEAAVLKVELYSEDETKVLATGSVEVSPNETNATVQLHAVYRAFPRYFTIAARLYSQSDEPMSEEYRTVTYTKDMQQLINSTIDDYDPELVINFDELPNTNFGVFASDAIMIYEGSTTNVYQLWDEDNNTAVFANCDKTILNLKRGDVLVYRTELFENMLVLKVAEITIDGNTATIVGDKSIEITDVFDYVKIETVAYSNSDAGYGEQGNPKRNTGEHSFPIVNEKYNPVDYKWGGISLKGGVTISATGYLKYNVTLTHKDITFKINTTVRFSLTVSASFTKEVDLPSLSFSFMGLVTGSLTPTLVFKAEASLTVSATMTASVGFRYNDGSISSIRTGPQTSSSIELEGKVYAGLKLTASVAVVGKGKKSLAQAYISAEIGVEFSGKLTYTFGSCIGNLSLSVDVKAKISAGVTFLLGWQELGPWNIWSNSWNVKKWNTSLGSHNFSDYGGRCCSKCGTEYSLSKDYNYGGKYAVGQYSTAYFYAYPYAYGSAVSSARNSYVQVNYAVVNSKGERWYQTSNGYYVKASSLTKDLSVVVPALDTNIGSISYYCQQEPSDSLIVSSDFVITCVSATLNGSSLGSTYPNAKSVNLRNAGFMSNAKWRSLPMGSYTLRLTVSYSGANSRTKDIPVTVNHVPVAAPSITAAETFEGKTITVRQNESGATLTYSYAGGTYTTSNPTVSFDISSTQTVTAFATASDGYRSAKTSNYYVVNKLDQPVITPDYISTGAMITISSEDQAVIYYTVNGGEEQTYSGPFHVAKSGTITARAIKRGCVPSDIGSETVTLTPPSTPAPVSFQSDPIIAEGRTVSVSWQNDKRTDHYVARLYCGETLVEEKTPEGTVTSFVLPEAGMYEIRVQAINDFLGNSEESAGVPFEAKAPSLVQFLDDDGSVLSEYRVPYGDYLNKEKTPSHRGHYFCGWLPRNDYNTFPILEDMSFTATYEKIEYDVTFYDVDGVKIGDTQKVKYQESAAAPDYSSEIPVGFAFMGWAVIEASESDSICDYTCVDANLKFQAVVHWANDELPVFVTVDSAEADPVEGAPCYTVTATLTGWPEKTTDAYLCIALKNQDPETGVWKTVYAERKQIKLFANESSQETMQLFYSGIASTAEVCVLARKSDGTTGSAYSEAKTKAVTFNTLWSEWTEWSTEAPADVPGRIVEQKTEYRFKDKRTTTCSNSTLDGWTQYDSSWSWGDWGAWSSWGTWAPSSNSSTQVESRTEWRYYYFYCPVCGGHEPFQGRSDCRQYSLSGSDWNEKWFPIAYKNSNWHKYSYTSAKYWTESLGDGQRWNFTAGNVNDTTPGTEDYGYYGQVIRTAYRYRTRSQVWTYYYYQWPDEWTDWSETPVNATSNRQVETRTVYRYKDEIHEYETGAAAEDISGTAYHFTGTINSVDDLSGKVATVMVYRSKNMDPNQYQMQFVGQTTILESNGYDITFKTIDEPSPESGNYVVCLGIQGTTGLIDVAIIEAPREEFTVRYLNEDGTVISEQKVLDGDNAVVPEPPVIPGSQFVGWSDRGTNIYKSCDIFAKYVKDQYAVVFVDWVNQTIAFQTCNYGDEIQALAAPTAEGYTFVGWDAVIAGNTTVTGNTVVSAVYAANTYTVRFLGANGEVIDTQSVEYMHAPELPEAPSAPDMVFLGWNTDVAWWQVTADIDISPIFIFEETAAIPQSNYGTEFAGEDIALELTAEEDATIHYTLDGSEPDATSAEYIDPIELTDESLMVRAIAVAPRKNNSPILDFVFTAQSEFEYVDNGVRTEIGSVEVDAVDGQSICLTVSGEDIPELSSFRIAIDCERNVFYPMTDDDGNYLAEPGTALESGELVCEATNTGWTVYWDGESFANATGSVFTIMFATADEFEEDCYPLTAYVCEDYTLDENGEPVAGFAQRLSVEKEIITCEEHSYVATANTATCTEAGTANFVCYRCGARYTGPSEALGHDFIAETTTATCTEPGQVTLKCSRCGLEKTEEQAVIGHDYVAGESTATCTADGVIPYTCSRCGDMITEAVPALDHSYIQTDVRENTCTRNGFVVYTCSACGDIRTEVLEAEHLNELQTMEDATCTEDGRLIYVCSRCGEESEIPIAATGHSAEPLAAVDATCTETGLTAGSYCIFCGEILEAQEEIPATGHNYVEETTAATCVAEGATVYTCAACGDTYSIAIPKAHHFVDGTCEFCGLPEQQTGTISGTDMTWEVVSDNADSVSLVIHGTGMPDFATSASVPWSGFAPYITNISFDEITNVGKYAFARCTSLREVQFASQANNLTAFAIGEYAFDGCTSLKEVNLNGVSTIGAYAFRNCSDMKQIEIVASGAFAIGNGAFRNCEELAVVAIAVPEGDTGSIGSLTFAGCDSLKEISIPVQITSIGSAAFMNSGLTDIYVYCGECIIDDDENTLGNPEITRIYTVDSSAVEEYAFANGYEVTAISNATVVPCPGHSIIVKTGLPATCTQSGSVIQTCSICGMSSIRTVAATGHNVVIDPAIQVTCTQSGLTEGLHCTTCNTVLAAQETIPAVGHSYDDGTVIVEATCTAAGEIKYTCTECGYENTEAIPAAEHLANTIEATPATCTETGLTEGSRCAICGAILVAQEEIPATGHVPVELPAVAPTCTQNGLTEGLQCAECGVILEAQESVQAYGHTLNVSEGHEATCTETGLSWSAYCTTCGKYIVKEKTIAMKPHNEAKAVTENCVEATCTTAGSFDSVVYCADCNTEVSRETVKVAALGHDYAFSDAIAPTCTEAGASMGCVCGRCGNAAIAPQEIPALGHELVADTAFPATCTENGLTAGEHCARCGEITTPQDVVPAAGHHFENGVCTVCGKSEMAPDIYSASLLLNEDIHVVYAAAIPAACENPYMTFRLNGETYTVTEYTVNDDGKCLFIFDAVTPQCMGDNITAILHTQVNGEDVTDTVTEYSVKQYCVNQFNRNPSDLKLKTLLSDLLTYGAAAQIYTGYKTRDLVTDGLELTPSEFVTVSGKNVSFTGIADSTCDWTSASLILGNNVAMRFAFAAENTEGLSVTVTVNGREETFTASEFDADGEGRYYVDFHGIEATEFDDIVSATFYRNGRAIGRTVNYSVNAYICSTQNSTNTSLKTLARALYNYGISAKAYSVSD